MKAKTIKLMSRIGGVLLLAMFCFILIQCSAGEKEVPTGSINQIGSMSVHFIDVGQGDAILIEADNSAMLIDAGENNKSSVVTDYLNSRHIKKLDYVIGTHPHSDHIGGLDTVLSSYEVDHVILPDVTHTTKTYESVLDVIQSKNLTVTKARTGGNYYLGSASFTILAPNSDPYEDMNNYSVVIRLSYGDTSFLLTGDAGAQSEKAMCESGLELSADVLKLGHHGSAYSSSEEFLDAVNPDYAVISLGIDNEYGHPHPRTLRAFLQREISMYRTDKQGTIVFTTDGNILSVNRKSYQFTKQEIE